MNVSAHYKGCVQEIHVVIAEIHGVTTEIGGTQDAPRACGQIVQEALEIRVPLYLDHGGMKEGTII